MMSRIMTYIRTFRLPSSLPGPAFSRSSLFPWRKVMNLSIRVEFLQAIGPTVWYSRIVGYGVPI